MTILGYLGAFSFGVIVGWYVYFINRYRKGDVGLGDVSTLIGVIGGGAVTALFDTRGDLFGCYGLGLFVGFYGYFLTLIALVKRSKNFTSDWFLDGRRIKPEPPFEIPADIRGTVAPYTVTPDGTRLIGSNPAMLHGLAEPLAPKKKSVLTEKHCYFCSTLEYKPSSANPADVFQGRAALLNSTHWGERRDITVGFIGGSTAVRERVKRIANEWSEKAGGTFKFKFWIAQNIDPSSAYIRVSFVQDGRSWSYIGTDALSIPETQATMNLGWLTEDLDEDRARAVVLHEFGHAIGLIHEHQNPTDGGIHWNIPEVVKDLSGPPNNWDEATIQNNMFRYYDPAAVLATEVDAASIMMYPIPEHWTLDDFEVGFNTRLSPKDIALVKAAYPGT